MPPPSHRTASSQPSYKRQAKRQPPPSRRTSDSMAGLDEDYLLVRVSCEDCVGAAFCALRGSFRGSVLLSLLPTPSSY
jgi:hypothetical protein